MNLWPAISSTQPPTCYVAGKGDEPATLATLRNLGFTVERVEQAPPEATWVVPLPVFSGPQPIRKALGHWRRPGRTILYHPGGKVHYCGRRGWSQERPAVPTMALWGVSPGEEQNGLACVMLLGADWQELDHWLQIVPQGDVVVLVGTRLEDLDLTDLGHLDIRAIVCSPHWRSSSPPPWALGISPAPLVLAGEWDRHHPEAFLNLLDFAIDRAIAQRARIKAYLLLSDASCECRPLLEQMVRLWSEKHQVSLEPFERLMDQLEGHLAEGGEWCWRLQLHGDWLLSKGEHEYRYTVDLRTLSYREEKPVPEVDLVGSRLPRVKQSCLALTFLHLPLGYLKGPSRCLQCVVESAQEDEWGGRYQLQPRSSSRLSSGYLYAEKPYARSQAAPSMVGFALRYDPEASPLAPEDPEPHALLLVPDRASGERALELLRGRSETFLICWGPGALVGRLVRSAQCRWLLCDRRLAGYVCPEEPEALHYEPERCERMVAVQAFFSHSMFQRLLPGDWLAGGLDLFLQKLTGSGRAQPLATQTREEMVRAIATLQEDVLACRVCRIQSQFDGGWILETEQPDSGYRWSPSNHELRYKPSSINGGGIGLFAGSRAVNCAPPRNFGSTFTPPPQTSKRRPRATPSPSPSRVCMPSDLHLRPGAGVTHRETRPQPALHPGHRDLTFCHGLGRQQSYPGPDSAATPPQRPARPDPGGSGLS